MEFVFDKVTVIRQTVLKENKDFKQTFGMIQGPKFFNAGQGQLVDEVFDITSGSIELDAKITRAKFFELKAQLLNAVKSGIMLYGEQFINDEKLANKFIASAFKNKKCKLISLEGVKYYRGDITVNATGLGKTTLVLESNKPEPFNFVSKKYDLNQSSL